jgi:Fur family peroxide stress response transcriptional regulator
MRKKTKQKETILKVLRKTRSHPTAAWIYGQAKREIPNISLGTVYRNLNILADSGDIQEILADHGLIRYDARTAAHYHFRCNSCGAIHDLDMVPDEKLEEAARASTGFKVHRHDVMFYGSCRRCSMPKDDK